MKLKGFVVLSLMLLPAQSYALDLVLPDLQKQAEIAAQRKKVLDREIQDGLARKDELLKAAIAAGGAAVSSTAQNAPRAGEQAANQILSAKEAVLTDVVCHVKDTSKGQEVSARTSLGNSDWQTSVKLGSVLSSQDHPEENLAVEFKAGKDGRTAQIHLVDLNTGDHSLKRKVTLQDLHLDADCNRSEHVGNVTDRLGSVIVDSVVKAAGQVANQTATDAGAAAAGGKAN